MLIYSHQLDVLMQSEEKVKALRHDMKNHLGELALMAGNQNNEEIWKYIQDMGEWSICRTSLNWSVVGTRILTVC